MTVAANKILDDVLALPNADRRRIAEAILDSMPPKTSDELERVWLEEAQRRAGGSARARRSRGARRRPSHGRTRGEAAGHARSVSRYRILDEAVADLDAAMRWYEEQREGLGRELLAEFRERVDAALEVPGRGAPAGFTPGGAAIRRYQFKQFKRYAILIATIDGVPPFSSSNTRVAFLGSGSTG